MIGDTAGHQCGLRIDARQAASGRKCQRFSEWTAARQFFLPSIVVAELRYGILRLPVGRKRAGLQAVLEQLLAEGFTNRILVFDGACATKYAEARSARERTGWPVAMADALIGGTALAYGAQHRRFRRLRLGLDEPLGRTVTKPAESKTTAVLERHEKRMDNVTIHGTLSDGATSALAPWVTGLGRRSPGSDDLNFVTPEAAGSAETVLLALRDALAHAGLRAAVMPVIAMRVVSDPRHDR
jgi:predicted nucleic acid-binding protein